MAGLAVFLQQGEDLESRLAQYPRLVETRQALHGGVPDGQPAVAIEGEYAVFEAVEQTGQELAFSLDLLEGLAIASTLFFGRGCGAFAFTGGVAQPALIMVAGLPERLFRLELFGGAVVAGTLQVSADGP